MKNFVIYLFIGLGLCSCNKKKSSSFTIEGRIDGISDSTKIYIDYFIHKNKIWEQITDSTCLENNKFFLQGNINELTSASLYFTKKYINDISIGIYLEPVAMKLVIDKNNPYAYKLSGTSVEKENIELRKILAANMKIAEQTIDSITEIFNQISLYPNREDSLIEKAYQHKAVLTANAKIIDSLQLDFINKHTDYQIIPDLLFYLARDIDLVNIDTVTSLYNGLPERSRATFLGKLAFEQIKRMERVVKGKDIEIGDIAPDFTRVSMQGDTLSLTDFRGKSYVLLDFWASWCGPCIHGIPDIKNIHNKYNKNLKIIGISSDGDKEAWQKAVIEHQIRTWPQILSAYALDNSYFGNEKDISEVYHVHYIPTYILIDKQGKVIAKWNYIGEEQLNEIDKILRSNGSNTYLVH